MKRTINYVPEFKYCQCGQVNPMWQNVCRGCHQDLSEHTIESVMEKMQQNI